MKIWKIVVGVAGGILLVILVLSLPSLFVFLGPKPTPVLLDNPGQATQTDAQTAQLRQEADSVFKDSARFMPRK